MLKAIDPDEFLSRHWQKESRFLKAGADEHLPLLEPDELAWLATLPDVESRLVKECITHSRFILTTRMSKKDITDQGYDFNGWVLEFYQEQCDGIVQIDRQGFYSPKG